MNLEKLIPVLKCDQAIYDACIKFRNWDSKFLLHRHSLFLHIGVCKTSSLKLSNTVELLCCWRVGPTKDQFDSRELDWSRLVRCTSRL